jgi:uncharacterized membrane protein YkoI
MKRMFVVVTVVCALAFAVPALAQDGVNIARAEAIIREAYPGVTIVSIQRGQLNNVAVWEARLADGTVIYVDAQTGEAVGRVQSPAIVPPAAQPAVVPPIVPARPQVTGVGAPAVGFTRALEIALSQYPGTSLIKAELEPREGTRGRGPLTWDMKMSNGMAVYVDANTGTVVELEPWGGRRGPSGLPIGTPAVSFEQALSIAQAQFPNLAYRKIELKQGGPREGYALVWEVDFGHRAKVVIDANTGNVLLIR